MSDLTSSYINVLEGQLTCLKFFLWTQLITVVTGAPDFPGIQVRLDIIHLTKPAHCFLEVIGTASESILKTIFVANLSPWSPLLFMLNDSTSPSGPNLTEENSRPSSLSQQLLTGSGMLSTCYCYLGSKENLHFQSSTTETGSIG